VLSTLGGWLFARQISRPLRRLEFAARELGRGDMPGTLKETGTQELVAVTRSFNQMAKNLRQLEQDRTLLLAGISHDLRTPITRIRLASEFLSAEHDDIKDGIVRDTEDMDEIIDQFIAFVRDGRDERSEPGDFNALVRHAAEPANLNGNEVIFELNEVPPVPFKALAMKRLVRNLVENALRYAGAPVTLTTSVEGNDVVLRVLDNGPGVIEADIPRLFKPFTRGDSARSGRGTGLGLAIVKRIADMHGASIELANRPQGGLVATLKIAYC
jgi:two-component system osmolarity sensor histidine kinase EnvZ